MKEVRMKLVFLSALAAVVFAAQAAAQEIVTRKVNFTSDGETMAGVLHLPADHQGRKLAGILVTGSWTTVKEQMPKNYAEELARQGYAALTFDFRNFGESGGAPRAYESPALKVADFKAAAQFLQTLPEVDQARIGVLAVCASAGYAAQAINEGAPLKSYAAVAGWFHDKGSVGTIYGGDEGVAVRLKAGAQAREAFEKTGEVLYVKAFDTTDQTAAMVGPFDYYGSPQRGGIAQWDNRFALMGWTPWLTYDSVAAAKALKVPSLFVHSDNAALASNVKAIHAAVTAPKELVWSGEDHFAFYDDPVVVKHSVQAAARHFAKTLPRELGPFGSADEARIISVVSSIPLAVDLANYDLAERAFAAEIVVDYTSLWGGEAQRMSPPELMAAWRGIVPGFDATRHEIADVSVALAGDAAHASAFVDGRHFLGGEVWRPVGTYDWRLRRIDGVWKVTHMTFTVTQEIGARALAEEAMERAKKKKAR
jgi:fermentation-respiration switch protein FrsA (DUF1100 family)